MTSTRKNPWTVDAIAMLASALASDDCAWRTEAVSRAISDGIGDILSDDVFLKVLGRLVFDSLAALEALPGIGAYRAAASEELGKLPVPVRQRATALWGITPLFDEAEAGRTYRLTRRIASLNAPLAARAMVRHDLGVYPAGGGGAAIVIPAIRKLNEGPSHAEWRFRALMWGALDDGAAPAEEVLWGTYLSMSNLFDVAEQVGAEATACTGGERRVLILNGRAAMVLDRADAMCDTGALDFARTLICDAWTTAPTAATRNVQHRLTRLSGNPLDRQILQAMTDLGPTEDSDD